MLAEHDGLAYFANHTGLQIAQTIHKSHDITPSIRDIRDLQTSVEQEAISVFLSDQGSDNTLLSAIYGARRYRAVRVVPQGDPQKLDLHSYRHLLTAPTPPIQSSPHAQDRPTAHENKTKLAPLYRSK